MAIRDIFKISRKTFFDPSRWIDYEGLKTQNKGLWAMTKDLFVVEKPTHKETFAQAMKRLGLTKENIQETQSFYQRYALFFFILGLLIFFFSFYLLFAHVSISGWLLGLGATAFCGAMAFRYDFWAFQIKHRKLGCTFNEWFKRKIT